MSNSLQTLLKQMQQQGSTTLDWGAIWTIDRHTINNILRHDYLQRLAKYTMLAPLNGELTLEGETEKHTFRHLLLGPPRLSFNYKVASSSYVTVTLDILAGTYQIMRYPTRGNPVLHKIEDLAPQMGYNLTIELKLESMIGDINQRGYITLDLTKGSNYCCNLGTTSMLQSRIGDVLCQSMTLQPLDRYYYALPMLDLNHYQRLSPYEFVIRTQASPVSDLPDSADDQEGGIVLFIRLFSADDNGREPATDDFPFFIPDDLDDQGNRLYHSSLVINYSLLSENNDAQSDEQIEKLKQCCRPDNYHFSESEQGRYTPYDMLIIGNVIPGEQTLNLIPDIAYTFQDSPQPLQLCQGGDNPITADNWQVSCLSHSDAKGTVEKNLYHATPANKMVRTQLAMHITASRKSEEGTEQHANALIINSNSPMFFAPYCAVNVQQAIPIDLSAWGANDAETGEATEIDWQLISDRPYGSLQTIGPNQARFLPYSTTLEGQKYCDLFLQQDEDNKTILVRPKSNRSVSLQLISASDTQNTHTVTLAIVISHYALLLPLLPSYIDTIAPGASRTFILNEEGYDPLDYRWRLLGDGTLDDSGRYTAPTTFKQDQPVAVVVCELLRGNDVIRHGMSIIRLTSPVLNLPTWQELTTFTLTSSSPTCFANGNQQIPLLITLESAAVEDVDIPVSDYELSRLRLVDTENNQEVPFLAATQEGIAGASDVQWAVNQQANRFIPYRDEQAETLVSDSENSRIRYRYLWLQTTEVSETPHIFIARFHRDSGMPFDSEPLAITSQKIPAPASNVETDPDIAADYHLLRQRVYGDDDNESDAIDYYFPTYHRNKTNSIKFATLKMAIADIQYQHRLFRGNISTIRWQTESADETLFSYTGYAFYPADCRLLLPSPTDATLDPLLYSLASINQEGGVDLRDQLIGNEALNAGEMIISLNRTINMRYWDDSNAQNPGQLFQTRLYPATEFILHDEEGNRHVLSVDYDAPEKPGSRHRLIMTVKQH
jgi:hypothetical protein